MALFFKRFALFFFVFSAFTLIEGGLLADYADARSKSGGRSFSSSPSLNKAPSNAPSYGSSNPPNSGGSFTRGLMGGLVGGALGGLLFGSMFGAGGSGFGILPLILLAVGGYFFYRRFVAARQSGSYSPPPFNGSGFPGGSNGEGYGYGPPHATPNIGENLMADGIEQIRAHDPGFDAKSFCESASDTFFKVQAGWIRRDLDSYRHLLGEQLAAEYAEHFAEMRHRGEINKLESIAVRTVEVVAAGSDGREDFVTVRFTASLLDYTVDEHTGQLRAGSMTDPVKFDEEWTWARPVGRGTWRLEGIREV